MYINYIVCFVRISKRPTALAPATDCAAQSLFLVAQPRVPSRGRTQHKLVYNNSHSEQLVALFFLHTFQPLLNETELPPPAGKLDKITSKLFNKPCSFNESS